MFLTYILNYILNFYIFYKFTNIIVQCLRMFFTIGALYKSINSIQFNNNIVCA